MNELTQPQVEGPIFADGLDIGEASDIVVQSAEGKNYVIARDLVRLNQAGSIYSEAIGSLRTNLISQHIRVGRRSLVICSPTAEAGSSLIAAAAAMSLGQAGIKTLLIDANMRDSGLASLIRPEESGPGLLQCLTDETLSFADVIQTDILPGFSMIHAGGAAAQPQELLTGRDFKALIEVCLRDFDVTIVDTPPASKCADARAVGSVLRYALVVLKRNVSYVSDARMLIEELKSDHVSVVGTFLNGY